MHRDRLRANSYNPNHVAPVELALLKTSITEDGWTQPIVVRDTKDGYEIVDGFHRWTLSADPEVATLTGGLVPVVVLTSSGKDNQMMSTIRHNRARGTHGVLRMAEIVRDLIDTHKMSVENISKLLGMEDEEIDRLYDASSMSERGAGAEFNSGWVPDDVTSEKRQA